MSEATEQKRFRGVGRLQQVVDELVRQKESARDVVVDTRTIRIGGGEGGRPLALEPVSHETFGDFGSEELPFSDMAVPQLCEGDIDDELEIARERISSAADPGERERAMFYAGYQSGIRWARSVIGKGDQST